jgi:hypothetical protein
MHSYTALYASGRITVNNHFGGIMGLDMGLIMGPDWNPAR